MMLTRCLCGRRDRVFLTSARVSSLLTASFLLTRPKRRFDLCVDVLFKFFREKPRF
jgi:hypothetical protein